MAAPQAPALPEGGGPEGAIGAGQAANALLRVAASAAGLALTLRFSSAPSPIGPERVGVLAFLFSVMELLAALPAGALSDRVGRRPLLLGGAVAGAAGLLITGLTQSYPLLAFGRIVQGLGTGCTVPPLLGWFAAVTARRGPARRGKVMAGVEAGTAAGLLGGIVLGGLTWKYLHFSAFWALAGLYVLAAALMAFALHSPSDGPVRVRSSVSLVSGLVEVLATPRLVRLLVAWVLLNSVVGLWLTHAPYQMNLPLEDPQQYLVGRFHGNQLNLVLALWSMLFIAGSLAWGPLLGRIEAWRAMRLALGGMLLVCAALVFLNAQWLPALGRWIALPFFCFGVLVEAGFAPAALSQLSTDSAAAHRGLTMGLYSVALGLGGAIGGAAGGPFAQYWKMNGVIALTVILAGAALATLTLGHRSSGIERA